MQRILLTGGSGFFSANWSLDTKNIFSNFSLIRKKNNNHNLKSFKIQFNFKRLKKIIKKIKPQIIIHNAAITDLDKCEKNYKLSKKINYELSKIITNICKNEKIKLIFISTDQLLNKNKHNRENYKKNPINYYSLHKSKSEDFIRKNLKNYLIIRTNFFGNAPLKRKSFFNFVKNNLEKNKKINLISDIVFNPISIHYLIKIIVFLINKNLKGIYHISSDDRISKYELGLKICKNFNLDSKLIIKSKLSDFNFKAKRPKYMYLNNSKIKKTIKKTIPSITKQLIEIRRKFKKKHYNNCIFK